jgi:ribosome-associated toxin RatA of RatAB toxin-antitoxin module
MAIAAICGTLLFLPSTSTCLPLEGDSMVTQSQQIEEQQQGITVQTTDLENGVTAVTGKVVINASLKNVWAVITDYDNQKNFVPKLIDSGLISDNGSEQVMFEKGKTGFLFFRKTVYIKLSVRSEYLQRLSFRQIEGDFKTYEGDWTIDRTLDGKSTMLTFRAKIKPDFFAPSMFVRQVQQHDLPMVLAAMKKRAESADANVRLTRASIPKHTAQQSEASAIAD